MPRPILVNDLAQDGDPNETPNEVLAEALNRPEKYTDDKGFEIELCGGDIHLTQNWIAWVDRYEKPNINWLHIRYSDYSKPYEGLIDQYRHPIGRNSILCPKPMP